MSDEEHQNLSHVAFAVLGLVAEYACHGKDINERIETRGMRDWTAIGKSSIYGILKNLKEKGYVDSWVEEEDNRIVKMYQITFFNASRPLPKGADSIYFKFLDKNQRK
ncbi:MAG: PadR family transcriptional regulator [Promethearchaeota archaeon]|jgi:DNA-binding PadR family transcriptional regulator